MAGPTAEKSTPLAPTTAAIGAAAATTKNAMATTPSLLLASLPAAGGSDGVRAGAAVGFEPELPVVMSNPLESGRSPTATLEIPYRAARHVAAPGR